ncbi:GerAB/ArcD/ProY family transporter [Gorillibacterium massiliense]|uniref:GerAB/ArcD/ProY family transporter n=1 Tax=Gorillibacterium massiliense TaxID=1280390 RepID=UPI0004AEF359|nr:endospore germination permease [Gorillibacterium massiliense]
MERQLTERQAVAWFIMFQTGSSFLVIPASIAVEAKQDAWLSVILAVVLQLLILPLLVAIARQFKEKNFVQYLQGIFGKWVGRGIGFFFILLYPYLTSALTLRNLSDFVNTTLMPETPAEVLYFFMMLAVAYSVLKGVTVCGRAAELLIFIVFVMILLVAVSLLSSLKIENVLPVFEFGWKPVMRGAIPLLAFPYLENIFLLFFVPHIGYAHWKNVVIRSSLFSGLIFFLVTFFCISVLSYGTTTNLSFPSFFIVRTITIKMFYERYEVLITVMWFITIFMRISLCMIVTVEGFGDLFQLKKPQALAIPLSLLTLLLARIVWPNIAFIIGFLQVWPVHAILLGLIFPILLWISGRIKRLKPDGNNNLAQTRGAS